MRRRRRLRWWLPWRTRLWDNNLARVGGVTGLVGAAGGLGGFVPPLIMGYVYGRTDSYGIGLALLSVTAALTLVLTLTVVRRTANTGGTTA